ncbi:MAG: hypothetical protein QOH16_1469 [Gaiellaceae bacterium]|nr:hypothetical protein [Gaiellaceae bacterium]
MAVTDDFQNFCYWADQLKQEPLARTGWDNSYKLSGGVGRGLSMTVNEPDETQFRSLLVSLRRFVSPKDPVFLNRIYNLCEQHIASDELKSLVRDAREKWKRSQRIGGITLVVNEREFTPEHLADLWINGHYFHGSIDDPKTRALAELRGLGVGLDRVNFVGFVGDALTQVLYVDDIIRHALRDGCVRG